MIPANARGEGERVAKFKPNVIVEFTGTLTLTQDELAALDALVGYGTKPFLEAFYENMGRAYLQPHEAGLVSLFQAIRDQAIPAISKIEEAKKKLGME